MSDTFGDLKPTDRSTFVVGANRHLYSIKESKKDYRRGQAFFNYFTHWFPDQRVPREVDPFYDPDNLPAFVSWVEEFLSRQK